MITYGGNDKNHCSNKNTYFESNAAWRFNANLTVGGKFYQKLSVHVNNDKDVWEVTRSYFDDIGQQFGAKFGVS